MHEEFLEFLKDPAYQTHYPKKDVRILWSDDRENCENITDFLVSPFTKEHNPQNLYQRFDKDLGNCDSGWDKWKFSDVLGEFFSNYSLPKPIKKRILQELIKITEFREDAAVLLYHYFKE